MELIRVMNCDALMLVVLVEIFGYIKTFCLINHLIATFLSISFASKNETYSITLLITTSLESLISK